MTICIAVELASIELSTVLMILREKLLLQELGIEKTFINEIRSNERVGLVE